MKAILDEGEHLTREQYREGLGRSVFAIIVLQPLLLAGLKSEPQDRTGRQTPVNRFEYPTPQILSMTNEYWLQHWLQGNTPWHNQYVHEFLTDYWDKIHPTDNFTHIYVPLCGKTVDMLWLYQKGMTVVGSDFVEEAAIEFVKEHPQLAMSRTAVMLKNGEQTVVYEMHYFAFSTGEKFDMVWDRGAFVALDPSMRQTFVDSTFGLLRPDFRWLQESVEYPPVDKPRPPHSVSHAELENIFGTRAKVQLLRSKAYPGWRDLPWCNRSAMLYSSSTSPAS